MANNALPWWIKLVNVIVRERCITCVMYRHLSKTERAGLRLSRSRYKIALVLTSPRLVQVVYKWFDSECSRVVITCETGLAASGFQTFSLASYLSSMDSVA